jgi:hypothetical protein
MVTGAATASPASATRPTASPLAAVSPPPGSRDLFPPSTSLRNDRPRREFKAGGAATVKSNKKCTKPFQLIYGPCRMKLRKVSVVPSKSTGLPPERCPGSAGPRTYVRKILSSAFSISDAEETTSSCTGTGNDTTRRTASVHCATSRRWIETASVLPPPAAISVAACSDVSFAVVCRAGFVVNVSCTALASVFLVDPPETSAPAAFGWYKIMSSLSLWRSWMDSGPIVLVCKLAWLNVLSATWRAFL